MSAAAERVARVAVVAARRVRAALESAADEVARRVRSLASGWPSSLAVGRLRSGLERPTDWSGVLRAGAEAIDDIDAAHEGEVPDQARASMASVVAGAVENLRSAPTELAHRLLKDIDEDLAEGASPEELIEHLSAEASAFLIAVGTEFGTAMLGLHREGLFGEMAEGGLDLFLYDGPEDSVLRPFCEENVGKVFTEEDLDDLDNGMGLKPTSRYMGGYNCRHVPTPVTLEQARDLPIGGPRARKIVVEGAQGPKEARFRLDHLGEVRRGRIVRLRRARSTLPGPEKPPSPPPRPRTPEEIQSRTMDVSENVLGRRAWSRDIRLDNDEVDRRGALAWRQIGSGEISFSRSESQNLRNLLAKGERGEVLDYAEMRALESLVHENVHGLGPWKGSARRSRWSEYASAYRTPIGQQLEEGSTELIAVRTYRRFGEEMGFRIPVGERAGPWRSQGTLSGIDRRHAYPEWVDLVEMLCEKAAGHTWVAGRMTAEGERILMSLGGDWRLIARPQLLARQMASRAGPLAAEKAEVVEAYLWTAAPRTRAAGAQADLDRILGARSVEELDSVRRVLGLGEGLPQEAVSARAMMGKR